MNFLSQLKRRLIYKFKKKISIDSDNIQLDTLDELLHFYGSDKANVFIKDKQKGHGYSIFYEDKLKKIKNKKINILEIGSYAGASAAAFAKYLPSSNVFCFDVNISNFKYRSKKIKVFDVDIKKENKIKKILDQIYKKYKIKEFDIIIDDGSHNLSDILIGIKFFLKLVKKNGLYIIEDFKYPNYHQYNRNINHIFIDEFLKNLLDKKVSVSDILSENEQTIIMNSIKKIENFKGNLDDSDISFITKS